MIFRMGRQNFDSFIFYKSIQIIFKRYFKILIQGNYSKSAYIPDLNPKRKSFDLLPDDHAQTEVGF